MGKSALELVMAILIPTAGAMGYIHGTFATKASVKSNSTKISRIDKITCKIAIAANIKDAEKICTD